MDIFTSEGQAQTPSHKAYLLCIMCKDVCVCNALVEFLINSGSVHAQMQESTIAKKEKGRFAQKKTKAV
jgi:hypothetical protein